MMNIENTYSTDIQTWICVILLLVLTGPSPAQLNDTGQMACANGTTVELDCNNPMSGTDDYPGQDAQQGLDAEMFNPDDGLGGFSFTKLDVTGEALIDQQVNYETTPWSCVQDNITGLMWEIKSDDGGLHDRAWTYSWYNSTGINDGGGAGVENSGLCVDATNCDSEKFTSVVNTENLCGHADWRLPDPLELLSIMLFNPIPFIDQTFPIPPTIDTDFFPHTQRADYWTSYTAPSGTSSTQVIYFGGNTNINPKSLAGSLRLVRGQPAEFSTSNVQSTGSQTCNDQLLESTPDERFVLVENSLVHDLFTNLNWPRCPQGYMLIDNGTTDLTDDSCVTELATEFTWQEALENAVDANNAVQMGHDNWRVPNIKELFSIKEVACEFPTMNVLVFPDIGFNRSWSSTANDTGTAEYLDFNNGEIRSASQPTPYTLRLVRDAGSPPNNDVIFIDGFE